MSASTALATAAPSSAVNGRVSPFARTRDISCPKNAPPLINIPPGGMLDTAQIVVDRATDRLTPRTRTRPGAFQDLRLRAQFSGCRCRFHGRNRHRSLGRRGSERHAILALLVQGARDGLEGITSGPAPICRLSASLHGSISHDNAGDSNDAQHGQRNEHATPGKHDEQPLGSHLVPGAAKQVSAVVLAGHGAASLPASTPRPEARGARR